jgi:hypothetical protein
LDHGAGAPAGAESEPDGADASDAAPDAGLRFFGVLELSVAAPALAPAD